VFFVLDNVTDVDLITFAQAWRAIEPWKVHMKKSDHLDPFLVFVTNSRPIKK
jgi:hypothetical protein